MKINDERIKEEHEIKEGDIIVTDKDKYLVISTFEEYEIISLVELQCKRVYSDSLYCVHDVIDTITKCLEETIIEIIPSDRVELTIK